MFQRILSTLVVAIVFVGLSLADDIRGVITKVDGKNVTFAKATFNKTDKKLEKGDAQTLPVSADVKVSKGKFNKETKKMEAGDAIEGGLSNEMFKTIGEKGIFATITTDSDNKKITAILVSGGKKKKDKN